jgi:hypothetical protein
MWLWYPAVMALEIASAESFCLFSRSKMLSSFSTIKVVFHPCAETTQIEATGYFLYRYGKGPHHVSEVLPTA